MPAAPKHRAILPTILTQVQPYIQKYHLESLWHPRCIRAAETMAACPPLGAALAISCFVVVEVFCFLATSTSERSQPTFLCAGVPGHPRKERPQKLSLITVSNITADEKTERAHHCIHRGRRTLAKWSQEGTGARRRRSHTWRARSSSVSLSFTLTVLCDVQRRTLFALLTGLLVFALSDCLVGSPKYEWAMVLALECDV
ncbi:hypothetical protein B0H13DRAFT_2342021 [Mycena leptocephala]|nr:hypothetical protein B0H13DRAFT_2342021 [Mycena leptocephala]